MAVVGAGPSGFYVTEQLSRDPGRPVTVDLFDRLQAPYGLVRYGVAPDHQKIKAVTAVFDRIACQPGVRFFGGVEIGRALAVDELARHYDQIVFCTGAQADRRLGIPGEDAVRSHPATDFVAWYNGHPDFRDLTFALDQERVIIVGVGNVAVDVARILCRTPEELARTDIAGHALEALGRSRVREVIVVGRRGPAQAAFTTPELRELGDLADADLVVRPDETALDPLSQTQLEGSADRGARKKAALLAAFAARPLRGRRRRLVLRFFLAPTEIVADADGGVAGVRAVRTRLVASPTGTLRAEPTGAEEFLPAGLLFRSVGYRGVPVPGLPFNDTWGVILNDRGRVLDERTREPLPGRYVAGWIKRGATGVIGTNKPDAAETVACMLEDAAEGRGLQPGEPDPERAAELVRRRAPEALDFTEWQRLDRVERARGAAVGRPRVKLIGAAEMRAALAGGGATSRALAQP